ncbi:Protein tyrosine phosphatase domain-containing protein 1 [Eumeta japonica]|uniref:Protein tyrosine phosphatase domain-containing protein 1 n=1 Tax=Eumeta variegata TaxID=151549 RepID=A0A4C1WUT1_EUMVA|nr:Protein tyrosine phosphatase domain-containing protein 1 [Eumeta japonica]
MPHTPPTPNLSTSAVEYPPAGLGRTGVLIACYLVYSLRVRANDAIRLVRKKRPRSVQTSGQILCVQQFDHYLLPQTVVFSTRESCGKDRKVAEFTLRQHLYRQRATLHGLEERAFRELPKIIYRLCERLLRLCGCSESGGMDLRIRNRPFYKNFLSYKLRQTPLPEHNAADLLEPICELPMVGWRDPIEEDIERHLESVSRITGSTGSGTVSALHVYQAFVLDHNELSVEKIKYLKQIRNDINLRRDAINKIDDEEDPSILSGLLFEWLEGLKQPVLDRDDLAAIVGRAENVHTCVVALQSEDITLLEYLLRFVIRLRPLASPKRVDILKRLLASLAHQTVAIGGRCLPTKRDFSKLREGTCNQVINFMLRMIAEIQKDTVKPGRDDVDVVVPLRRMKPIKAWK